MIPRSLWICSCSQHGSPTAATSSSGVLDRVDSTIPVPMALAAPAEASSPSGWTTLWNADGASTIGTSSCCPATVTDVSTSDTSRISRLRISQRS